MGERNMIFCLLFHLLFQRTRRILSWFSYGVQCFWNSHTGYSLVAFGDMVRIQNLTEKQKRKIKWGKLLKKLEKKDSGNLFQGCDAWAVQSTKKWKQGCASLMDYVDAESSFEEKPLKTYNPLYTSYFTNCNSETMNNNSQNFLFFKYSDEMSSCAICEICAALPSKSVCEPHQFRLVWNFPI